MPCLLGDILDIVGEVASLEILIGCCAPGKVKAVCSKVGGGEGGGDHLQLAPLAVQHHHPGQALPHLLVIQTKSGRRQVAGNKRSPVGEFS